MLATMQKYPDAAKAPKGFLAKLEKWKAAAYKANETNASLQIYAGDYIKDQKLLQKVKTWLASPKGRAAPQDKRVEMQSYVMMAQDGKQGWQKKLENASRKMFGGGKPPQRPDGEQKIAVETEQNNAQRRGASALPVDDNAQPEIEVVPTQPAQAKPVNIKLTEVQKLSNDYSELPEIMQARVREYINEHVKNPPSFRNGKPHLNPINPTDCSKIAPEKAPDGFIRTEAGNLAYKQTVDGMTTIKWAARLDRALKAMIRVK